MRWSRKGIKKEPRAVFSDRDLNLDTGKWVGDGVQIQRAELRPVIYNEFNLNELIFTVVKALQNVSCVRYYIVKMRTDILKGTETKRIFDNSLHKIPEFGSLRELPYETVQSIVE